MIITKSDQSQFGIIGYGLVGGGNIYDGKVQNGKKQQPKKKVFVGAFLFFIIIYDKTNILWHNGKYGNVAVFRGKNLNLVDANFT